MSFELTLIEELRKMDARLKALEENPVIHVTINNPQEGDVEQMAKQVTQELTSQMRLKGGSSNA